MRIVVIGGTTFIGPRVLERLRDHDVTVFHRGTSCNDATHIHDDRANLARHELEADVVIDMIAMSERDAETLVAAKIAPRIVVISSADVYRQYDLLRGVVKGEPDPIPLSEDAPLRETLFPYGGDYEKILAERVVLREPGATVLRLPAVYGPGDPQKRFAAWLQPEVVMSETYARWRWTRGFVDNVADAIVLAATNDAAAGRIYNAGEADAPTEREWAEMCGATVRVTSEVEARYRFHLVTDTSAIRRELGYAERVSREDAVRITASSQ